MKTARFILKIIALSFTIAAVVCAVVAYWDKLSSVGVQAKSKIQNKAVYNSEYDDYEE